MDEQVKQLSKNRFGIIQLSDLQFGEKHRFGYPSEIAEKLLGDIKKMSGEGKYDFTPLYIVLSGDITEKAHSEEFNDAANVIEKILDGLNIDRTNILSIPGNHDVNWNLSMYSQEAGDDQLKFLPYNKFVSKVTNNSYTFEKDIYPRIIKDTHSSIVDEQLKIDDQLDLELEFLLVNSCEKEDPSNHEGYVCPEKLKKTLPSQVSKEYERLKIAILHHRLDTSVKEKRSAIENAGDIESIIACHKYNVVLTGHVHKPLCRDVNNSDGHNIIFAGCGSTGVNQTQREDGVQNQYCIHVIDLDKNEFQSIWRAFNPSLQTEYGLGGWTKDNSFGEEPRRFALPNFECKDSISPQAMIDTTCSKPIAVTTEEKAEYVQVKPTAPVMIDSKKTDLASKIAAALLLGGWNEKD